MGEERKSMKLQQNQQQLNDEKQMQNSPNEHMVGDSGVVVGADLTQDDLALFQSVDLQPIVPAPNNADDLFIHKDFSGESGAELKAPTFRNTPVDVTNSQIAPPTPSNQIQTQQLDAYQQQTVQGIPGLEKMKQEGGAAVPAIQPQQYSYLNDQTMFQLQQQQQQHQISQQQQHQQQSNLILNSNPQLQQPLNQQQRMYLTSMQSQYQNLMSSYMQQQQVQESSVFELGEGETYGVPVAPPTEGDGKGGVGVDDSAACYGQQQAAMIVYYQVWMQMFGHINQMPMQQVWNAGNNAAINPQQLNPQQLLAMQQYQQYMDAVAMTPGMFGVAQNSSMPLDTSSMQRLSQQQIALQQQQQQQSQSQRKRPRTAPTRKTHTDTERRPSLGLNSGANNGRKPKSEDKVCNNCGTRKTPFWRKDKIDGQPLCNACGLYFSKNDAPRPAILWKNNEDTNDEHNTNNNNSSNNNNNNNISIKTEPVLPMVQPAVQAIQAVPTVLPLQISAGITSNNNIAAQTLQLQQQQNMQQQSMTQQQQQQQFQQQQQQQQLQQQQQQQQQNSQQDSKQH